MGNEAVARGLYEAGVKVVSAYPGTPSTEITESAVKYPEIYCEWAPNEKVATETACGASIGGARSFCAMKHVGLNVAADPLFTMSYIGVNGGMVLAVADDPGMQLLPERAGLPELRQGRQAPHAGALRLQGVARSSPCWPTSSPSSSDTPVILRLSTRVAHSRSIVETEERQEAGLKPYVKNPAKNVMLPAFAKPKHEKVEARTQALIAYGETTELNKIEDNGAKIGVITSGVAYQYVKEAMGDKVNYLQAGPGVAPAGEAPAGLCRPVRDRVRGRGAGRLHRDPLQGPGDEGHRQGPVPPVRGAVPEDRAQAPLRGGGREPVPGGGHSRAALPSCAAVCPPPGRVLRLEAGGGSTSAGTSAATPWAPPLPCPPWTPPICMGASVSALHGFNKARGPEAEKKSVAVIGDSTFAHSGITSLIDIAYNRSNSVVIVLDNSITGMTGHQQNPTTGFNIKGEPATAVDLEALCHAIGIRRVTVVDPYDLKQVMAVLKEELAAQEPSVIISRRPCALLKYVKHNPPLSVAEDKCVGCKACLGIGCPAISYRDGKAVIDGTQCVGCGVCESLCPKGAIG